MAVHMYNVYGWNGYDHRAEEGNAHMLKEIREDIGTLVVPWVCGGDWNRTPNEAELWWAGVGIMYCFGQTTQARGRELDWFVTAPVLGEGTRGACPVRTLP